MVNYNKFTKYHLTTRAKLDSVAIKKLAGDLDLKEADLKVLTNNLSEVRTLYWKWYRVYLLGLMSVYLAYVQKLEFVGPFGIVSDSVLKYPQY